MKFNLKILDVRQKTDSWKDGKIEGRNKEPTCDLTEDKGNNYGSRIHWDVSVEGKGVIKFGANKRGADEMENANKRWLDELSSLEICLWLIVIL